LLVVPFNIDLSLELECIYERQVKDLLRCGSNICN
jgi:hypothetical protein